MAQRTNASRQHNRSNRRRLDDDTDEWAPWADIHPDTLFVILIKLGLIDYLAFSGVCKSWRTFALANRATFLARKEPLPLQLSKGACTFIDIFDEGRRYKTMLPDIPHGSCLGVSCGYLIMLERITKMFTLVNPITRNELRFPALPRRLPSFSYLFHPILVYSSLLSKFVIIALLRLHSCLLISGSGDSEWVFLPKPSKDWDIVDLTVFEGKVYVLNRNGSIGEMRLHPLPSLLLLDVKSMPSSRTYARELVTSSGRLFMVDPRSAATYELDFKEMEWVVRENLGEEVLYITDSKCSSVVNSTNWGGHGRAQSNITYILTQKDADAWYFPRECYGRNLLNDL